MALIKKHKLPSGPTALYWKLSHVANLNFGAREVTFVMAGFVNEKASAVEHAAPVDGREITIRGEAFDKYFPRAKLAGPFYEAAKEYAPNKVQESFFADAEDA